MKCCDARAVLVVACFGLACVAIGVEPNSRYCRIRPTVFIFIVIFVEFLCVSFHFIDWWRNIVRECLAWSPLLLFPKPFDRRRGRRILLVNRTEKCSCATCHTTYSATMARKHKLRHMAFNWRFSNFVVSVVADRHIDTVTHRHCCLAFRKMCIGILLPSLQFTLAML